MGGTYRDLVAWQKSIELTVAIYKSTQSFPSDEKFWPYESTAKSFRLCGKQHR